jgi:hypothetical protein
LRGRRQFKRNIGLRGLGAHLVDAILETLGLRPVAHFAARYEDFRRVDGVAASEMGQVLLPLGEAMLRKTIGPAEAVPVVHVQGERHDTSASAAVFPLAQPAVGGWAAIAALAAVELHQGDAVGWTVRCADRPSSLSDAVRGECGKQRDGTHEA